MFDYYVTKLQQIYQICNKMTNYLNLRLKMDADVNIL